jgi:hypothetical protein
MAAILTCFRNEEHILQEWIEHYKKRGIEHIYMINDFSKDNYLKIIQPYINSNYVTLFNSNITTNQTGKQIKLYNKYFYNIVKKQKHKWFFILDLDEFLYSPNEINLNKILNKYDNYSQLIIGWQNFGSNSFIEQPKNVVYNFTKRSKFEYNKPYISYKSGFKSSDFISFNIHRSNVSGKFKWFMHNNDDSELIINHYSIQSWNYFINTKTKKGDVNNYPLSCVYLKPNEYKEYFNLRDSNEISDTRLKEQNFLIDNSNKNDDVTVVITSCNRSDLLSMTLDSFIKYNTYPIKKFIIIEDSGKKNINDFCLNNYPNENIQLIYNNKNIGQIESIDKVYYLVDTKWIFHCEEDWLFTKKGFIEESLRIFKLESDKLFTVWLRPYNDTNLHPIIKTNDKDYNYMDKNFSYFYKGIKHTWCGFTFNPGLRKTKDALLLHPYIKNIPINPLSNTVEEYIINKSYYNLGYYAAITNTPEGYCKHIGRGRHIKRNWE